MAFYKQDIVDVNLETGVIHRSFLNHTIGHKDDDADRFGIRAFRNGDPVDLSGAQCQAVFMAPDGTNIALTSYGTVSGNEAYVTLPQACYNVEGQFCLAIKLVGGGVTATVRIIDGVVDRTGATGAVAPTEAVPTYQEILAVYAEMQEDIADYESVVANQNDQINSLKSAFTQGINRSDNQYNNNQKSIQSAVTAGMAQNAIDTTAKETNTGIASRESSSTSTSRAYSNGFIPAVDISIIGLKLTSGSGATGCYIYVFDENNTLSASYTTLTCTKSNNVLTLSSPVTVKKGYMVLVTLTGGSYYYTNTGTSNYYEYKLTQQELITSGIICGFDFIYKELYVQFKSDIVDNIETVRDALYTAVGAGYAEYVFGNETETDSGKGSVNKSYSTYNNAYSNGIVFNEPVEITGFSLYSGITSTQFIVYVFNSDWQLIYTSETLEPTITDHAFSLDTPLELPNGGSIMLQFLDGIWYAYKASTSDYKEYRPASSAVYDSVLRAGFDIKYEVVTDVQFKRSDGGEIKTTDFNMPKVIPVDGQYTLCGRWFDENDYKCANADGSSIMFKVKGANAVTVQLEPITTPTYTPYLAYSIDGGAFTRQLISNTSISLPDTEEHFVWIVVDGMGEKDPTNGKWEGTVGIKLVSISGGTLTAVQPKNRRMLIVGDSMVEGINALGEGANANVNSATAGFAWKTARALNAIPLLCGYGGTSTLGDNSFHKAIEAVQYNMENVPVNQLDPDVVMIEHGYNDQGLINLGLYTVEDFIAAYTALINKLCVMYPGIPILCMIPFSQRLAQQIRQVANGFSNAYVVETYSFTVATSDGVHPSAAGSTNAANNLKSIICDIFGEAYFTMI